MQVCESQSREEGAIPGKRRERDRGDRGVYRRVPARREKQRDRERGVMWEARQETLKRSQREEMTERDAL